ncbi:TIGR03862 family flavoprotein [Vogesella alkaliphila]|uniref:NAD(FAD)-utilizing dehydrogenase n=1 Tax=Vogesella alkaliphila TaxID=1193621 RepID=A0ABQ2YQZ8_9NEIS|nr:TIGR03862 family flavoprotein [Vogesella alkaliphila]GGX90885.1 NAD(FAD)-utilizing dehydrogenase [Vogesella alkaliphila]
MPDSSPTRPRVAIIGGGPAGLIAAETLLAHGAAVELFDAMPSVGRKFLLAGVGGMNITHSEPRTPFLARYGRREAELTPIIDAFDAAALRDWVHSLGIDTFVGSSGKVFPTGMKAAPLLRAWLTRLRDAGLHIHVRHRWLGWDADGGLRFATPDGEVVRHADAVLLALGGGSWAKLGSDGKWLPLLQDKSVAVAELQPSNCGFDAQWSAHFREKFAGSALKNVALTFRDACGQPLTRRGECVVSAHGIEGNLVYAFSAAIRDEINAHGSATILLDLAPDRDLPRLRAELERGRGAASLANHLRKQCGIDGVRAGLLRELLDKDGFTDMARLAAAIKALPLTLHAARPLDEAISSAGGVRFDAVDSRLMLRALPGVFVAGEMLDWEAPTGGYLLTACFASGRAAAQGMLQWLSARG